MKLLLLIIICATMLPSCTRVVLYEDTYLLKSFERDSLKSVCSTVSRNLGIGVQTDTLSIGYITNVDPTAGSTYNRQDLRDKAIEDSRKVLAIDSPDVIVNDEMTLKWLNDSVISVKHLLPNYLSGHSQNDLYMSCVIQEYQLRNGLRSPAVNQRKSRVFYTTTVLVSPVLGIAYLSKNNPLYPAKETILSSAILLAFESLSLLIYLSKPSKDFDPETAGIMSFASFRALMLVGTLDIKQHNRIAAQPYDLELMYRDKLPLLGIETTK